MNTRNEKGFTLIEMAIVLVIIGLILGAVSIGKDLQRNAEYDKVKQKFVDQWVTAYNTYYQRVGIVVGDSETAPRLMIAGSDYATPASGVISGGNMTGIGSPGAICQGVYAGVDVTQNGNPAVGQALHAYFDQAGIRMPPGRAEGSEDRYAYLDSNGNPQEIQVCFQWNTPGTPAGSGNVMVITGLTPDLARALDQMVDGKPDAQEGVFRQFGVLNGVAGGPGIAWTVNNTQNFAGGTTNLDEDQIAVVTAIYKMNQ
ncbi:MAG: prepilin-type N-terminal cleavage/methylation domain-containing protein [Mariprofundaceae bacterium]